MAHFLFELLLPEECQDHVWSFLPPRCFCKLHSTVLGRDTPQRFQEMRCPYTIRISDLQSSNCWNTFLWMVKHGYPLGRSPFIREEHYTRRFPLVAFERGICFCFYCLQALDALPTWPTRPLVDYKQARRFIWFESIRLGGRTSVTRLQYVQYMRGVNNAYNYTPFTETEIEEQRASGWGIPSHWVGAALNYSEDAVLPGQDWVPGEHGYTDEEVGFPKHVWPPRHGNGWDNE
jgi:hypothetical protein